MPCRSLILVVVVLLATFVSVPRASAVQPPIAVTTCDQTIPHGRNGYLPADLTCPAGGGVVGVRLGGGSKLDLQGHTLTGGVAAVACGEVYCDGLNYCGPTRSSGKCEIANGTITGARYEAVSAGKAILRNMTLVDNGAYGVLAFHHIEIYDSHFANMPNGAQANRVIRVKGSTFDATTIQSANKINLESSSVTNGLHFGVAGVRVRLKSSSVTGNGTEPTCGQPNHGCADIISGRAPWLDGASSCGTSLRTDSLAGGSSPVTWGVCTLD